MIRLKFPYFILNLLICCTLVLPAYCQVIENHFTHYTAKDGVAEGGFSKITQDSTGFLWLGTASGLSRFDGKTFKIYRYNELDSNSLRENQPRDLFVDPKGQLWILTFHWLHLYHPDGQWFEHYHINMINEDLLEHICLEENNQIVIAGRKALYKFDTKQKRFSFFNHEGVRQPMRYFSYLKDEDGIEWLGTGYGLVRYDPQTQKMLTVDTAIWKDKQPTNFVNAINILPDGNLFVQTYNCGLYIINRKTLALHLLWNNSEEYKATMCAYFLNDSILIATTSNGLLCFNLRTEQFYNIRPDPLNPSSLSEYDIQMACIFRDREGILWFGGYYLEKYDFKDFNVNELSPSEKEKRIPVFLPYIDMYRTRDGKFVFGGYWAAGLYDPTTQMTNNYPQPYPQYFFKEDAQGSVWGYAKHHLVVYNIKNNNLIVSKQYDLPGNIIGVQSEIMDHKGRVLMATANNGLAIFDTTHKTFSFVNDSSQYPPPHVIPPTTAVCEDHKGIIWTATYNYLYKIDSTGKILKRITPNQKNRSNVHEWVIKDIKEDQHGIIWFSTIDQGIGRLDPRTDSIKFLSTDQGLPTCYFDELCIDDNDNLWARSITGILNVNVVTLQNKLYTEDEGFPFPPDIKTIHYSKYDKKLYILTNYSIFEVNTKNTEQYKNIPGTTITGFSVFNKGKPYTNGKDIHLNYNENFIKIDFACLLFHSNKQIKYAYKLDGIDKDWVYCNYIRSAFYTNLPPGNYIFNVKAQSPDGVWSETPTLLSIIINPPYWQTWWFYLLEGITGLLFALWIVRLYTARKLAKQKIEIEKQVAVSNERTRIATDMHDDMGAGLTSIRLLSEIANLKTAKDNPLKPEIEKIVRSAENLSENMKEIIWTMNTRFDKLDDFIIYIRSYAAGFFEDSSINFHFYKPEIVPELYIPGELRRNIFLCIKEALNNIVKHSQATDASLTISIKTNCLSIEIKDNGVGFDLQQINKFGNGIKNMKERINKGGNRLDIEVDYGVKLTFSITI